MAIHTSIATPTADSYISVASADDYFDTRQDADPWLDIENNYTGTITATAKKESLLKQATREIDKSFRFFGGKYNTGTIGADDYQALQFPRSSDLDNSSDPYLIDEVRFATCEHALWLLTRNQRVTDVDGNPIKLPKFSDQATDYLRKRITRQVQGHQKYVWQN